VLELLGSDKGKMPDLGGLFKSSGEGGSNSWFHWFGHLRIPTMRCAYDRQVDMLQGNRKVVKNWASGSCETWQSK